MKLLLKNATILDPRSKHHGKTVDIFIKGEKIETIGKNLSNTDNAKEIDLKGVHVSPGFCDLYAHFCDPGLEHRETLETGAEAAAAGGFTGVCLIPDTRPFIQSKTQVEYLINSRTNAPIDIYPLGAVTENLEGKNPTEIYDMHRSGAVAFTDAPYPVKDSGVMLRALQYCKPFDGVVFSIPYDRSLTGEGQVNEGEISVVLGMKGLPDLAEELQVHRDIELAAYADARIHFNGISTKTGLEKIRKAKKEGLKVTASVFAHQLMFEEKDLLNFDPNYKVMPPLRNAEDRKALIKGIVDGTIDCISTQHTPLEIEAKKLEFEYAGFGIIGLETAFGTVVKVLGEQVSKEKIVELLSVTPRMIIGKNIEPIEEGAEANFAMLDFDSEWTFGPKDIKSRSQNTPYIGTKLKGKVKGIFNKGVLHLND